MTAEKKIDLYNAPLIENGTPGLRLRTPSFSEKKNFNPLETVKADSPMVNLNLELSHMSQSEIESPSKKR